MTTNNDTAGKFGNTGHDFGEVVADLIKQGNDDETTAAWLIDHLGTDRATEFLVAMVRSTVSKAPARVWTLEWTGYVHSLPSLHVELFATEDAAWDEVQRVFEEDHGMSFEAWCEQNNLDPRWRELHLNNAASEDWAREFEVEEREVKS